MAKQNFGVPSDHDVIKNDIIELMEHMDTEQLRMLYITAKVWAEHKEN